MSKQRADLWFDPHGSITLIRAATPRGQEWLDEHIPDDAQTFCGAIVCEYRFVQDIYQGAENDGLRCE